MDFTTYIPEAFVLFPSLHSDMLPEAVKVDSAKDFGSQ